MTLSPGDTIQIILTVGGVPYAKTWKSKHNYDHTETMSIRMMVDRMTLELIRDIDLYANEGEAP